MTENRENPGAPAGEPPAWTPGQPGPVGPAGPAGSGVAARRPARVVKLWHAALVGLACLIAGMGIGGVFGGLLGYAVGEHHGERDREVYPFHGGGPARDGWRERGEWGGPGSMAPYGSGGAATPSPAPSGSAD